MKLMILDTRATRRGAQVFAHELSKVLSDRDVSVTKVYLYSAPDEGKLTLNTQDIELGGDDAHYFEKFPTVHPGLLKKLAGTIKHLAPDIVLLNGSRTLKYGAAVKLMLKSPPVFLYRVIDSVKFWNNSFFKQQYYRRLIMPALDAAVGVSQTSLDEMVNFHQFRKPARAIPRAVDTVRFAALPDQLSCRNELGANTDEFVLLFLGNITSQKRPDRFVNIIAALKKEVPDIKGWIVGDGPLRQQTEMQAKEKGLESNIQFWGYQHEVGRFIAASNVLVLCSDTEGLPGVVLEAAAAGVPTIAGQVGGVKECIDHSLTGFIVNPDDEHAFVKFALELFRNKALSNQMGEAARKKIQANYSIQKVGDAYLEYLNELVIRKH